MTRSVGELTTAVLDVAPGQRVGYVTDLRYTDANLRTLAPLLAGVDPLFIESVFLDADRAHAQRKNHLTARQAGLIAREVGARAVVPFHFSPRYGQRAAEVMAEVRAAWSGPVAPPRCGRWPRSGGPGHVAFVDAGDALNHLHDLVVGRLPGSTPAAIHPLTHTIGASRATLHASPASCAASTTAVTSL